MVQITRTDVVIVGAGPTGLSLAIELATQQIAFRIVEKALTRSDKSRALIVQPRTQELFNRLGRVESLIADGNAGVGAIVHVNGKCIGNVDMNDLGINDTAFAHPLFVSQVETENFLVSRLKSYGKEVEHAVSVDSIIQDEAGVSLTLKREGGGFEKVRAKYVVGADGAHSIVRHAAGLKFEGGTYAQDFILADVHLRWDRPMDHIMMFFARGVMVLFPMKGHPDLVRLICLRPPDKDIIEKEPTLEDFQSFFNQMAPSSGELYNPVWITRFRLHHRGVDNYRTGRLFVAGDAAHIHSPAGGQGMNTGIQDAINLGWKLGRVLRGEKDDKFLDSYNAERFPIGQTLLRSTDRLFEWSAWTNPVFIFFRNLFLPWIFPWITSSRARRATMFQFFLQFGIHYRGSPIVGNASGFNGPVRGGDRAPDGRIYKDAEGRQWLLELCRGTEYHLVIFSGPVAGAVTHDELARHMKKFIESNPDRAGIVTIYQGVESVEGAGVLDVDGNLHKRYGFEKAGYVYVRPDGYVAYAGFLHSLDEFLRWLQEN